MIVVSSVLSSIVHIIWFYILFFFRFLRQNPVAFVEKFDAFSRFSMVVSSITCTVRRVRSKEVKTQVKKSRKEWRISRACSSLLCTKEKTKKKSLKNVSQFDDERACSIFYLRLVVFLLFFFFGCSIIIDIVSFVLVSFC